MEKHALILFTLLSLLPAQALAQAAPPITVKKKSLEEIQAQLNEKRQELEKYREEESRISAEITTLKKEDKLNVERQKELQSQLDRSRSKSSESKQKFESLEKTYKDLEDDIYGEIVRYSLERHSDYPYYGQNDISRSLLLKSVIFEKHNLIARIKGETSKVRNDIQTLSKKSTELKAKKELLDKQRSAQKNEVKTKMTELARTKDKQAALSRELENLQNAALGLTKLVKKLEKQSPYKAKAARSSELPITRHSLPWPAQGRIISRFGREEVPVLKTWIVREGIRIRTDGSVPVFPVMSGKVIYAGPFRTYGNVVIVDHEKGFFTIYGLLDNIAVGKSDLVTPSSPLGRSGMDTQAVSQAKADDYNAVYFEIRVGADAVDPAVWLVE